MLDFLCLFSAYCILIKQVRNFPENYDWFISINFATNIHFIREKERLPHITIFLLCIFLVFCLHGYNWTCQQNHKIKLKRVQRHFNFGFFFFHFSCSCFTFTNIFQLLCFEYVWIYLYFWSGLCAMYYNCVYITSKPKHNLLMFSMYKWSPLFSLRYSSIFATRICKKKKKFFRFWHTRLAAIMTIMLTFNFNSALCTVVMNSFRHLNIFSWLSYKYVYIFSIIIIICHRVYIFANSSICT